MSAVTACALGGCWGGDASPGQRACPKCADELRATLREIGDLYATIDDPDELLPAASGDRGSPGFGPRSPAVDALLTHLDPRTVWTERDGYGALATVAHWARRVRADRSLDTAPDRMRATVPAGRVTMTRELGTLRFEWDWVLGQDWLPQMAHDMRRLLLQLRAAGRVAPVPIRLGACPVVVEVAEGVDGEDLPITCGTTLRVTVGDTEIRCRGCRTPWPRERWHQLGDPWADYATLAEQLDVKVGTLRRWCHEDEWEVAGTRGRRLVRRADALVSYAHRRGGQMAKAGNHG